jgi:ribosomal-protein-alanine N-acetyltransferase
LEKEKMKLKGKGFVLRRVRVSDSEKYFEMMQDKFSKLGFMSIPKTLAKAKEEVREKMEGIRKKKPSVECFAIEVDGEFAGYVEINNLYKKHFEHRGNLGYCIHPKFRGRGLAAKATKIVVDYVMKKHGLKRVEGWCRTFNKASAKTMKKAGFKLEGILRKNKFRDGKYLDDMIWGKVR